MKSISLEAPLKEIVINESVAISLLLIGIIKHKSSFDRPFYHLPCVVSLYLNLGSGSP